MNERVLDVLQEKTTVQDALLESLKEARDEVAYQSHVGNLVPGVDGRLIAQHFSCGCTDEAARPRSRR
jgi:hypothetical protein